MHRGGSPSCLCLMVVPARAWRLHRLVQHLRTCVLGRMLDSRSLLAAVLLDSSSFSLLQLEFEMLRVLDVYVCAHVHGSL